jgi:hypothetical protein
VSREVRHSHLIRHSRADRFESGQPLAATTFTVVER